MKLFHIILIFLIATLSVSIHSAVKDSDISLMDELKAKKQAVFRTPYLFGCKVFQDIADQLGFAFEQRVKTCLALSHRSEEIFDQMKVGANSIPLNHHRIWLTSLENPVEMPATMMHFYLESLDCFSSSWKHFFWCLNPQDIPQTVKALADRGVVIVPVSEIYQKMIARGLFDVYLGDGHFSLAANILRQEILNDRGGLYADAGIEILMDPRILMGNYKYILSLKPTGEGNSYLDQDVCAACPKSLLQGIFLGRLGKPQEMPDIFRPHLKSPESQVNLVRPPHLMFVIDEMLKGKSLSDARFLFLDGGVLFNRNGQSTWAHGKFGSKPISNLTVNIFDVSIPPFYDSISRAWLDLWAPKGYMSSVTQILYPETWRSLEKGIRQKRFGTFQAAQRRLLTLEEAARREGGAPLISHRIWITSSDAPHEVPDEFLKKYFQSLERQEGEWRHFFWCVDPERIAETIKKLQTSPRKIEVHRLSEIFPGMKGKFIFDFYMAHSLWALAKDIASYNIVFQMGGLYSDIGLELRENMSPYLRAFDNIFANNQFYPDMSFFALRQKDSAFALYLNYLEELKTRIPNDHHGWHLDRALDLHGAGGLIYFVDTLMPRDTALLLVPDESLFKRNGTGSWKGKEGNFGSLGVANPMFQKTNFFKWRPQESEGPRWWD